MKIQAWDKSSPRAVVPSSALLQAVIPVKCDTSHAANAALPYGCALICETDADIGTQGPVPMFWVSKTAAESRGRGVEEGWYVLAHIGDNFSLHITNVHEQGDMRINGRRVDHSQNLQVAVKVEVDGTNPIGKRGLIVNPGKEAVLRGFAESTSYRSNETEGDMSTRRFKFERANVSRDQDASAEDGDQQGSSCIRLQICLGLALHKRLDEETTTDMLSAVKSQDEEAAVKKGESVRVNRTGTLLNEKLARAPFELKSGVLHGTVKVFIRERYWLVSRNIIDERGRAWKPKNHAPIDLTGDTDDRPRPKRNKLGVVDLTQ